MVFDNREIVTKLNVRRYIVLLLYLTLMGLLILSGIFKEMILGINKSVYIVVVTIIYIIYIIYAYIANYNYFAFNDEGNKLVFRFVSLRPFDNKKQAIEIQKKDFKGYVFRKSLMNIREDLILTVLTKNGLASYPPIGVTALSVKHKNMLINSLNRFI